MREALVIFLMVTGSVFMFLSALGLLRMPDLFTRMHAATKVGTVGISGIVLAVAVQTFSLHVAAPAITIILFFLVTAPILAHLIAQAAYHRGVPLWSGTVVDEWKPNRKSPPPPPEA